MAAWKQLERQTARTLGGKRNPASAGVGGADVEAPGWIAECKYRQTLQIDSLFREERSKRRGELKDGTRFVLVVRAKGREPLAVVSLKDFQALADDQGDTSPLPVEERPGKRSVGRATRPSKAVQPRLPVEVPTTEGGCLPGLE